MIEVRRSRARPPPIRPGLSRRGAGAARSAYVSWLLAEAICLGLRASRARLRLDRSGPHQGATGIYLALPKSDRRSGESACGVCDLGGRPGAHAWRFGLASAPGHRFRRR